MNKKSILIAILGLAIILLSVFLYFLFNPVIYKGGIFNKVVHAEYKEKFKLEDQISFVFLGSKDDVHLVGSVDTQKKGKYDVQVEYNDKLKPLKVEVSDTKPPTLEVSNYKTDTFEKVNVKDFSPKAKDADPSDKIQISMDKDDSIKKSGTFEVKITAEDSSGNKAYKVAKLKRSVDKTPPAINVGNHLSCSVGQELTDDVLLNGVTTSDNLDKNPKITIDKSNVKTNVPGTYKVKYKCKDRSGNHSEATRDVIISMAIGDDQKVIYLTFDDGPSPNTGRILDILAKYDVKGTFFVTGNDASCRHFITRAAKEGHTIGLHTYTHQYNIYSSKEAFFDDLNKVNAMVKELTGKESHYTRFAGGSSNTISRKYSKGIMVQLVEEVEKRGFRYYDWNASSDDAAANTVPRDRIIRSSTASRANHICLLMHDSRPKTTTADALPVIIEHYKKLGYTFLPISESTPVFHHHVNN
ncbi:hypothetical protein HMPREF1635_04960 [Clostridiales bacterium S5-A14a]|nr:hypothetical protein HMPREF1635_04960 [Clostridiales bacterium S5-A14a]